MITQERLQEPDYTEGGKYIITNEEYGIRCRADRCEPDYFDGKRSRKDWPPVEIFWLLEMHGIHAEVPSRGESPALPRVTLLRQHEDTLDSWKWLEVNTWLNELRKMPKNKTGGRWLTKPGTEQFWSAVKLLIIDHYCIDTDGLPLFSWDDWWGILKAHLSVGFDLV